LVKKNAEAKNRNFRIISMSVSAESTQRDGLGSEHIKAEGVGIKEMNEERRITWQVILPTVIRSLS
jgi:hypothetical protein